MHVQSVARMSRLPPMSAAPPVRAAAGWTPGPDTHEARIARAAVADLRQRGGQVGVRQTYPGTQCGARRDHARHPLQLHRPNHWLCGAVISVCSALGTPLAPQIDLFSPWIAVGPADEIWYWSTCWPAMLGEIDAGEGRAGVAAHPQVADVSAPAGVEVFRRSLLPHLCGRAARKAWAAAARCVPARWRDAGRAAWRASAGCCCRRCRLKTGGVRSRLCPRCPGAFDWLAIPPLARRRAEVEGARPLHEVARHRSRKNFHSTLSAAPRQPAKGHAVRTFDTATRGRALAATRRTLQ